MLKRYSEVFRTTLLLADLLLVAASWLAAYWVRFETGIPAPRGVPAFSPYLATLVVILPLWLVLFRARGLYEPRRTGSVLGETLDVARATTLGVLILIAVTFFAQRYFHSRGTIALFFGLSLVSVAGCRLAIRAALRGLRLGGYNLRYVLIAGAGQLAEEVIERIHSHPETGLRVVGLLTDDPAARRAWGAPVLGSYAEIEQVLREQPADQVILALPREESDRVEKLLAALEDKPVNVWMVPDLLQVLTLRSGVEDFDGLPMISIRESPFVGWAAVRKRAFDVAVAGTALVLLAPLLAAIAIATLLDSRRPILYRQERMGLDGKVFRMLKFRTMVAHAERETGPVWARPGDARRTRLGAFLRRTSLDELPQLWNVLRGDMSLVGPRPERPVFIEQFRREVPGYMLRHTVKAGLTGWAQVHGWRGNTSLHERIDHDLYYIQHWSLGLDVRILVMTLWRGVLHRNAY